MTEIMSENQAVLENTEMTENLVMVVTVETSEKIVIEEKLETPEMYETPEIVVTIEMGKKAVSRKTLGQPVTRMITEKGRKVNRTERMINMKTAVTEGVMGEKMLPELVQLKHVRRTELKREVMPEMIVMAAQEYVLLSLRKKVCFFSIKR